jgi:RNA polymerase sigma-70 factor (ECF subfamily)
VYNGPTPSLDTHRPTSRRGQQQVPTDEAALLEDDLLVARTLAGERAAFGTLVERYKRPVYHLALRLLGNPVDAEDAAQEAFVRAYVRLASYQQGSNFKAWLLAITAHWCIDQQRRRKPLSLDAVAADEPALATADEPESQFLSVERQSEVQSRLANLPEHYRQVLVLRYWEDLSYAEVGRTLGQPTSTVRMRLFRAHRRMAQERGA